MILLDVLGGFRVQCPKEEGCATSLQIHTRYTKESVETSYITALHGRMYRSPAIYATSSNRRYAQGGKRGPAVSFGLGGEAAVGDGARGRGASGKLPRNAARIRGFLVSILRKRHLGRPDSTNRAH